MRSGSADKEKFVKWRCAITLLLLMLAACGGGGGPATPTVAISVTSAKSPVLVTYTSNTVRTTYPSPVPVGTQVNFTASSPNVTMIPATAMVAGGSATVRVKSSVPGKYLITATSTVGTTVYTGSATVTFINQPASVNLSIALQPVVNNLGSLQFTIVNDPGIGTLQNFSFNPGLYAFTNLSTQAPPNNRTNVGALANISVVNGVAKGFDVTSTAALFQLTYNIAANGVLPGFSIDPASVQAIFADGSSITPPPTFLINWKYDTDNF
jgi:hypothetical protein